MGYNSFMLWAFALYSVFLLLYLRYRKFYLLVLGAFLASGVSVYLGLRKALG